MVFPIMRFFLQHRDAKILVSVSKFIPYRPRIDMRLVTQNQDDRSYHPTKCGFYFLPEQLSDMIEAMQIIKEKVEYLKVKNFGKRRLEE